MTTLWTKGSLWLGQTDVSEGGFKWKKGYAVLPVLKTGEDLEGSELSRWVKLSDKDREDATFDIKGPVKEKEVTQESRQTTFDNYETTDDHGMVIVGYAKDREGTATTRLRTLGTQIKSTTDISMCQSHTSLKRLSTYS